MTELMHKVEANGFAIVPSCLDEETMQRLADYLGDARYAQRNLLSVPIIRELATYKTVRALIGAVLGPKCFAVRGILFNKTQRSNWKVVWHQDLTIAVCERRQVDGFGPWTMKAGVLHVQPSAEIMGRMLAIRLHLDDSGPDNGPLRVIPSSHRDGRLSSEQMIALQKNCQICTVPRGGALLMRPLLLHSSSACAVPKPRRVIHLEFAADELPHGLEWYEKV